VAVQVTSLAAFPQALAQNHVQMTRPCAGWRTPAPPINGGEEAELTRSLTQIFAHSNIEPPSANLSQYLPNPSFSKSRIQSQTQIVVDLLRTQNPIYKLKKENPQDGLVRRHFRGRRRAPPQQLAIAPPQLQQTPLLRLNPRSRRAQT
jgi:hypothetical protein